MHSFRWAYVLPLSMLLTCVPARATVVYVNKTAPGAVHDGTTWPTAFITVQSGVTAAARGDEVWVARGTYTEGVVVGTTLSLYGGFAGTETDPSQRSGATADATTLTLSTSDTILQLLSPNCLVDGFTITGVHSIGIYSVGDYTTISNNTVTETTTGIAFLSKHIVITHNKITNNQIKSSSGASAGGYGAGISCLGADAVITDNFVSGNSITANAYLDITLSSPNATAEGAGIYVSGLYHDDGPNTCVIARNVIQNNRLSAGATANDIGRQTYASAYAYGGGLYVSTPADTLVADNVLAGNAASASAYPYSNPQVSEGVGAFIINTPNIRFRDNLVVGSSGGGAVECVIYSAGGVRTYANNTIAGNTNESGLSISGSTSADTVAGNIIVGNGTGLVITGTAPTLRANDVYGNTYLDATGLTYPVGVDGNIRRDPLFVSASGGDYRLLTGSPCIDTGDDSVLSAGETDLDGGQRKLGAHVDMGAYEFPTSGYFTMADAASALRAAGGLNALDQSGLARLNVWSDAPAASAVDIRDAIAIARKAAGLGTNP